MFNTRKPLADARRTLRDRADAARDLRDWPLAATLYEVYLAGPPRDGDAALWVQLGHARKEAGDREGARRAYEAALERDPADVETRVHLGHLHKAMGSIEAALAALDEALALEPHRHEVARDLAELRAALPPPPAAEPDICCHEPIRHAFPPPLSRDQIRFEVADPRVYAGLRRRFGTRPDAT